MAAVRLFRRGQLALDVPLIQTRRAVPGYVEFGGGVGDVNLGARYDFTLAGGSRVVPGIAALLGVTLPTGRAADAAHNPLATDATGIGAFQGTIGIALEQTFGPVYLGVNGILSVRSPHSVLATCSADLPVRLWNTNSGANLKTLTGFTDWVYAVALSPDGTLVAGGSRNGEVRVWKS